MLVLLRAALVLHVLPIRCVAHSQWSKYGSVPPQSQVSARYIGSAETEMLVSTGFFYKTYIYSIEVLGVHVLSRVNCFIPFFLVQGRDSDNCVSSFNRQPAIQLSRQGLKNLINRSSNRNSQPTGSWDHECLDIDSVLRGKLLLLPGKSLHHLTATM